MLLTLDKEGISDFIDKAKKERKEKIEKSQNLLVHMIPDFAEALKYSSLFSGNIRYN